MSSWAQSRKTVLVIVGSAIVLTLIALITIAIVYDTPTCTDGKQNQDERGIDCGGSCTRVCTLDAQEANVKFVRTISQVGRTDVIAYIENRNQEAAAQDVPYVVEVYDATRSLVGKKEGVVDLAPGATTPLFVTNIPTGSREALQAFVLIDPEKVLWEKRETKNPLPVVRSAEIREGQFPRIVATLENQTARPIRSNAVVVTVFNRENTAIAASRTVVGEIPAGQSAEAIFTWPAPFAEEAVRVEVLPVPIP